MQSLKKKANYSYYNILSTQKHSLISIRDWLLISKYYTTYNSVFCFVKDWRFWLILSADVKLLWGISFLRICDFQWLQTVLACDAFKAKQCLLVSPCHFIKSFKGLKILFISVPIPMLGNRTGDSLEPISWSGPGSTLYSQGKNEPWFPPLRAPSFQCILWFSGA